VLFGCLLLTISGATAGQIRLSGLTAHTPIHQVFPVHVDGLNYLVLPVFYFSVCRHDNRKAIQFLVSNVTVERGQIQAILQLSLHLRTPIQSGLSRGLFLCLLNVSEVVVALNVYLAALVAHSLFWLEEKLPVSLQVEVLGGTWSCPIFIVLI